MHRFSLLFLVALLVTVVNAAPAVAPKSDLPSLTARNWWRKTKNTFKKGGKKVVQGAKKVKNTAKKVGDVVKDAARIGKKVTYFGQKAYLVGSSVVKAGSGVVLAVLPATISAGCAICVFEFCPGVALIPSVGMSCVACAAIC